MPHLITDRLRELPECPCAGRVAVKRSESIACALTIEAFDILAGVIFVVGSVCFLPSYAKDLTVFMWGCILFVLGSVIYLLICTVTYYEAIMEKGFMTFEACENALYWLGSLVFTIGTILYWPKEAHTRGIEQMKSYSLGVYFNFFSPEFEGSILFILGSCIFALAAFVNGLSQRCFDTVEGQILTATTSFYMIGSLLFVMGSVAFLPDLGCDETMLAIGAWNFIVGSLFFVVGGILSLWRLLRHWKAGAREREKLVVEAA